MSAIAAAYPRHALSSSPPQRFILSGEALARVFRRGVVQGRCRERQPRESLSSDLQRNTANIPLRPNHPTVFQPSEGSSCIGVLSRSFFAASRQTPNSWGVILEARFRVSSNMANLMVIRESHKIFRATSQYTRSQAQYLHYCANLILARLC